MCMWKQSPMLYPHGDDEAIESRSGWMNPSTVLAMISHTIRPQASSAITRESRERVPTQHINNGDINLRFEGCRSRSPN